MKVTIHTTNGGLKVKGFDRDTLMPLMRGLDEEPEGGMLQFELDDGATHVFIQKRHIVRVDVDFED